MANRARASTDGQSKAQEMQELKLVLLWVDDNKSQRANNRKSLEKAYPEIAQYWDIIEHECLNGAFEAGSGEHSTGPADTPRRVDAILVDHYLVKEQGGTPDKAWGEELIMRVRSYRERYGVRVWIALYSGVALPPPHVRGLVDHIVPTEAEVFGQRLQGYLQTWYQEFHKRLKSIAETIDRLNNEMSEEGKSQVVITWVEQVECCRSSLDMQALEELLRWHWDAVVKGSRGIIELVDGAYRRLEDYNDLVWRDEQGQWWRGRQEGKGTQHLSLSQQEDQLLTILMLNESKVCKKAELLHHIWGYGGDEQALQTLVKSVRRKLGDKNERWIVTVRGVGYIGFPRGTGSPL